MTGLQRKLHSSNLQLECKENENTMEWFWKCWLWICPMIEKVSIIKIVSITHVHNISNDVPYCKPLTTFSSSPSIDTPSSYQMT